MFFEIGEHGSAVWRRYMGILGERLTSPKPFFQRVEAMIFAQEKVAFDEEGPGWKPLHKHTLKLKAKHHQDPRILRASGALERALTRAGAPGQIIRRNRYSFRLAIDGNGPLHFAKRLNMTRPMLQATPELSERITVAFLEYLESGD